MVFSHFGTGRARSRLVPFEARGFFSFFIVHLLSQADRPGYLVAHLHAEPTLGRRNRQITIAQASDEVEGLLDGLLLGQAQGVFLDVLLDGRPDVGRGPEEAVGRHEALEPLVWALEVVGVDEELEPSRQVREVREDRAREKLLPQGLPEALDLAEGLGVLGPALDVPDALAPELLLEFRRPSPGGVLPALVREDLPGRAVGRDAALEGFHDELALLVVGQGVADDEARVVVHEGRKVDALVLAQEKREDVRLPELVGLGSFEAPLGVLTRSQDRLFRKQPLLVKDPADLGLRYAERLEAREDVTDAARAVVGVLALEASDGFAARVGLRLLLALDRRLRRAQALHAQKAVAPNPRTECRRPDPVRNGYVAVSRTPL